MTLMEISARMLVHSGPCYFYFYTALRRSKRVVLSPGQFLKATMVSKEESGSSFEVLVN